MSMSVSPLSLSLSLSFSLSLNLTNKSRYIFNSYELKNHKNMRGGTPSLPPPHICEVKTLARTKFIRYKQSAYRRAEGGREMGNRQPPTLKDKEIFISPGPNTSVLWASPRKFGHLKLAQPL